MVDVLLAVVEVPVIRLADLLAKAVAEAVMVVVLLPILVVEEVVLLQVDLVEMVLQELLS
jgi:hypothetical protein